MRGCLGAHLTEIKCAECWAVLRGVAIRGDVEALVDVEPPMRGMSREIIRIHPVRIRSWGLAGD
jgi:pyridoxamine 5'-phosphate oxidase family protein